MTRSRASQGRRRDGKLPIRIEWGSAFELITTVSALLKSEQHAYYDLGVSGFAKIAAQAGPALQELRWFAAGSLLIWDRLFGIASELGSGHDAAALAGRVGQMDPSALRLELLGLRERAVLRAVGTERIEAAAAGDLMAQRDLLRLAWPEDPAWQSGARALLKAPPEETQSTLVALLKDLGRRLESVISRVVPALEADALEKRAAAPTLDPAALIRTAIDTSYAPTGDVHSVVLVPSYAVRPYVYYFEHADQMLFIYPVADRFLDMLEIGPPDRLVRLASALGDRGRLQILTALKERDMSLKELGERLKLPRSSLRHHVDILRGAGLLRPMQTGAGFSSYQLREEAATDLAELVDRFLRR